MYVCFLLVLGWCYGLCGTWGLMVNVSSVRVVTAVGTEPWTLLTPCTCVPGLPPPGAAWDTLQ